jgi:hypothetical protein
MKGEVKTPVIVVVVILVLGVVVYFGMKMMSGAGGLDQGQIQYTPGTPPWMEKDPNKKGVGGLGSHGAGAPPAASTNNAPANAPPGMGAPVLGNGGSK